MRCATGDIDAFYEQMTTIYAATDEKHDAAAWAKIPEARRREGRGIEVGQIFYFGKKYSETMNFGVVGPDGTKIFPEMGSYGIGVSRLVGAIIEASHDEAGIIWPDAVAPFRAAILNLRQGDAATDKICEDLHARLGADCLYDDREERAGAEIRGSRPDGPSLADHRRPARGGERPGGAEAPRHRRALRTFRRRRAGESSRLMFNAFERKVAARYLRARRGERFVSVIAIFSLVGIALGVATLIIVMSVMNGFRQELLAQILGLNGDVGVYGAGVPLTNYQDITDRIRQIHGVTAAFPIVQDEVLMSGPPAGPPAASRAASRRKGCRRCPPSKIMSSPAASRRLQGDGTIAIGSGLASQFGVTVGSTISLILPQGKATIIGTIPSVQSFRVVAVFQTGMEQYDSSFVFLPLGARRRRCSSSPMRRRRSRFS